ncbi:MAG: thiamine diphosphokinase [Bacteroidales bacterium]|nr:thiamine diphosphokinase [Bacteroidales bacterium]
MRRTIILANGQFPRRKEALQAMLEAETLICCDGAYDKLVESQLFSHAARLPQVVVIGDGDSLTQKEPTFPTVFVSEYTDQETNDLTKVVRYALAHDLERLIILGATGLREDHTLGNISLLANYSSMTTPSGNPLIVRLYTDYGFFTPITKTTTFPSFVGQQVSLFSLDEKLIISVEGLKFSIDHRRLHYWWEGTLNEALGDRFTVALSGTGTMLVYQTFEAK